MAALAYAGATACNENLQEGRAGCPALCPGQSLPVIDTTIDGLTGLAVDTTVAGYPSIGTAAELLVANGGDSLDVRGIIRFDSISFEYAPKSGDTLRPGDHRLSSDADPPPRQHDIPIRRRGQHDDPGLRRRHYRQ